MLTRLPGRRLSPVDATAVVTRLAGLVQVVPADAELQLAAIERCASIGRSSGSVYDALHVVSAERAAAAVLYTFNARHFEPLATSAAPRIAVPAGGAQT